MGRTFAVVLMLVVATTPAGAQQAIPPRATPEGAPVLPADVGVEVDRGFFEALRRFPVLRAPLSKPDRSVVAGVRAEARARLRACLDAMPSARACMQACAAGRQRGLSGPLFDACVASCFREYQRGGDACLADVQAWHERELRRRPGAGPPGP